MNGSRFAGMFPVALAAMFVVGVTAVQGLWTDRWSGRDDKVQLKQAAEILESRFPSEFGSWEFA